MTESSNSEFSTRALGKTTLQLSELGLGCAAMAGNHRPVTENDNRAAIDEGLKSGITFVDTAPFYGFGRSEHYVGDAIRGVDNLVLSDTSPLQMAQKYRHKVVLPVLLKNLMLPGMARLLSIMLRLCVRKWFLRICRTWRRRCMNWKSWWKN